MEISIFLAAKMQSFDMYYALKWPLSNQFRGIHFVLKIPTILNWCDIILLMYTYAECDSSPFLIHSL